MRDKKWTYGRPRLINVNKFYITDLFAPNIQNEPKLLWNIYSSEEAAQLDIAEKLKGNFGRYVVTPGAKAIRHKLKFYPYIRDSALYRGSPYYLVDYSTRYKKKTI